MELNSDELNFATNCVLLRSIKGSHIFSYSQPSFINPKSSIFLIFEASDRSDSQIIHTTVWINKVGCCGGLWR